MEIRNQYQPHASAWQTDNQRHRKTSAALNLALTRNVRLVLIPFSEHQPLAHCFEPYQRDPREALCRRQAKPVLVTCQPNAPGIIFAARPEIAG